MEIPNSLAAWSWVKRRKKKRFTNAAARGYDLAVRIDLGPQFPRSLGIALAHLYEQARDYSRPRHSC